MQVACPRRPGPRRRSHQLLTLASQNTSTEGLTLAASGLLFCPPVRKTAGTLRVAVPASVGAPWGGTPPLRPLPLLRLPVSAAGGGRLRSCSRLRLHQLNIPDCCNLIEQGLDPATFSLSRIIAIKNSPAFSVRLSFVAGTPLPPARSALFPIPRGLSRGLTNSPRTDFACAAMPRNRAPARCKNQRSALVPKYTAADSGHYRCHILRACNQK